MLQVTISDDTTKLQRLVQGRRYIIRYLTRLELLVQYRSNIGPATRVTAIVDLIRGRAVPSFVDARGGTLLDLVTRHSDTAQ